MLRELSIKNYALVEQLELGFGSGLNIFTGETGAGKSIIIDALGLVLGERANQDIIRGQAPACEVRALFQPDKNYRLDEVLQEQGIESGEELLLCRVINREGKSRCLVNGSLVTLGILNKIGECLVDIHGQHEHQVLLRPVEQLKILDNFADLSLECRKVKELYTRSRQMEEEYNNLALNEQERKHLKELYEFQVKEIEKAGLLSEEEEKLTREQNVLSNAEKLNSLVMGIYNNLYEEEHSVLGRLKEIKRNLSAIIAVDERLEKEEQNINEVLLRLEDFLSEVSSYREKIEFNPQRLEEVLNRQELIDKLKKKYGFSVPEILTYKKEVENKLANLVTSSENKEELAQQKIKVKETLYKSAEKLSARRRKSALVLEEKVRKELRDLGMKKAGFKVRLETGKSESGEDEITSTGLDRVEFLISTNPGEELKPLARVASGGEISRIMLGLKTVLAKADEIPVLIFDEIDAGVGGAMGEVVGEKLRMLSSSRQIICITHLPQIASFAGTHFKVEKEVIDKQTHTLVRKLGPPEKVEEIARLLGGKKVTEISLRHAQELVGGVR